MFMWCERISATFAGVIVGLWYAKTFPAEDGKDSKDNKGKDNKKK
ncbi:uncharacterized protein LOC133845405 [Drosophila sulfurigaster albostrigata]|nr:uncharacterized protein LOC133845405 [Drosophila sulfurigaster albostrigata]XP_062135852.1 uncharacterized protein LOC133845405 [Drosophila sulfurigaster albostrigata]XP_062135853.1 uncharacterized protein LOC133845405 [Drosophila sulfurigaster albostrigata]